MCVCYKAKALNALNEHKDKHAATEDVKMGLKLLVTHVLAPLILLVAAAGTYSY